MTLPRLPLLVLLVLPLLTACEEDLVLVTPADHPFSLYGVLDPKADTQFVFVFPVEPALEPAPAERLDARVSTTRLTDGAEAMWRDSLVFHPTGGYGHVFWSTEALAYDTRYRLEAERADGEVSHVEVRVPPPVSPRTAAVDAEAPTRQRILLDGEVDRFTRPELELYVRTIEGMIDPVTPLYRYRTLFIPLGSRELRRRDGGWEATVDLEALYAAAYDDLAQYVTPERLQQHGVQFLLVTLRMIVADEGWEPPEGGWDPELLVHPEAMRNVQNGFGFVTAGYRVQHAWRPSGDALRAAGFALP